MAAVRTRVAILGGDPIIGESLEALLRAAGYRARFLAEDGVEEVAELLADAQLLILAPALSSEARKVFLDTVSSQRAPETPVLELSPVNGEEIVEGENVLPWPCSLEKLKQAVESALLARE